LRRLRAQPFSSLSNILVISLTLAIPIVAASLLISAQPVLRQIPVSPEVTLFLSPDASPDKADDLARKLETDHTEEVLGTRVVSRAQALASLKADPSWNTALAALPGNPLPDAVVVTLRDSPEFARTAAALAEQWRGIDVVDAVQLDSEWVRRLEAMLRFGRIGLL